MNTISDLKGKIIKRITGAESGSDRIEFILNDDSKYAMFHIQDCCEGVCIEDIIGDVDDLLNSIIITAEERTSDKNPDGVSKEYQESFTWTFYEISTIKGSVTIRWYGESNGYYSEGVDFGRIN